MSSPPSAFHVIVSILDTYVLMYIFQEWHLGGVEALDHLATLTESSPYNVLEFTTLRGGHTRGPKPSSITQRDLC